MKREIVANIFMTLITIACIIITMILTWILGNEQSTWSYRGNYLTQQHRRIIINLSLLPSSGALAAGMFQAINYTRQMMISRVSGVEVGEWLYLANYSSIYGAMKILLRAKGLKRKLRLLFILVIAAIFATLNVVQNASVVQHQIQLTKTTVPITLNGDRDMQFYGSYDQTTIGMPITAQDAEGTALLASSKTLPQFQEGISRQLQNAESQIAGITYLSDVRTLIMHNFATSSLTYAPQYNEQIGYNITTQITTNVTTFTYNCGPRTDGFVYINGQNNETYYTFAPLLISESYTFNANDSIIFGMFAERFGSDNTASQIRITSAICGTIAEYTNNCIAAYSCVISATAALCNGIFNYNTSLFYKLTSCLNIDEHGGIDFIEQTLLYANTATYAYVEDQLRHNADTTLGTYMTLFSGLTGRLAIVTPEGIASLTVKRLTYLGQFGDLVSSTSVNVTKYKNGLKVNYYWYALLGTMLTLALLIITIVTALASWYSTININTNIEYCILSKTEGADNYGMANDSDATNEDIYTKVKNKYMSLERQTNRVTLQIQDRAIETTFLNVN